MEKRLLHMLFKLMELPDCKDELNCSACQVAFKRKGFCSAMEFLCDDRHLMTTSLSRHDHPFQMASLVLRVSVPRMIIMQNLSEVMLQMHVSKC